MSTKVVWRDPIVEEIHRIRSEIAEKYHHDLDAIAKAVEEKSHALGFKTAVPVAHHEDSLSAKAS